MAKDPKVAKRRGTRAEQSELALNSQSQVQSKAPPKVQVKGPSKKQAKVESKKPVKKQPTVKAKPVGQIRERAMALAAAAVLTLPLAVAVSPAEAQSPAAPPSNPIAPVPPKETTKAAGREEFLLIRMERTFTVLGVGDGHTILRDAEGSAFYLDPATGDKQMVAANYFLMRDDSTGRRIADRIKFTNVMIVAILGTDAHGNTVMRDARNETFTLDPASGGKVLIKWAK